MHSLKLLDRIHAYNKSYFEYKTAEQRVKDIFSPHNFCLPRHILVSRSTSVETSPEKGKGTEHAIYDFVVEWVGLTHSNVPRQVVR